MPSTSSKKPSKVQSNSTFTASEFINFPLSAEQKKDIKKWSPSFDDIDDMLLKLSQAGYRVSLRYDDRNEAFAAWFNPIGDEHHNAGLTLSGRGSTPLK